MYAIMNIDSTTKTSKDVMLFSSDDWYSWLDYIQSSVLSHLWKYFDPDKKEMYDEPEMPSRPTIETNEPEPEPETDSISISSTQTVGATPRATAAQEKKYQKNLENYYQEFAIFEDLRTYWERYMDTELRLRNKIRETVHIHKSASLLAERSVRQWLTDLRTSTAPSEFTYKESIRTAYTRLMSYGFEIWPPRGPAEWLAKWETLMVRSENHKVPIRNWLEDVSLVWMRVPDLTVYFTTIELKILEEKTVGYKY